MKRIAFYGGSFDPIHNGHLAIARNLLKLFELDEFVFIPAFHAPHKRERQPTSAFHRFAMLSLATQTDAKITVSTIEVEMPEKPYSIETLSKLKSQLVEDKLFFVIGADSWEEITTWRDWENLLKLVNFIVVTRPNYEIGFTHVTDEIRNRIVDLRKKSEDEIARIIESNLGDKIYITDAVLMDISATEIRQAVHEGSKNWAKDLPSSVAEYIKKYKIYV